MQKLILTALVAFLALFVIFNSSFAAAPRQPNVIIFLVDDMGVMDTSVPFLTDDTGRPKRYPLNDFYRTPVLDVVTSPLYAPDHLDHRHQGYRPEQWKLAVPGLQITRGAEEWRRLERAARVTLNPVLSAGEVSLSVPTSSSWA